MSAEHRQRAGLAGKAGAVRPRRRHGLPPVRTLLWLGPLIVIGLIATVLLISSAVPYQPFELYSYVISPDRVCTGAPVTAKVTREFTDSFTYLRLSETWVTVNVPGYGPDRPIEGNASELPPAVLHPTGRQTVPSPLLTTAPPLPGQYRVQIIAQYQGTRWGFYPAIGSQTFTSSNTVTVIPCEAGRPPA